MTTSADTAASEPDILKEIAQRLTIMLMSAKCYIDPSDDDVVIGYRIKTGALHQIIGMLECAGYHVSIPSNLPAEDGRGYVGIEPGKVLSTPQTTGSAPGAIYQEQDGAGHWIDIPRIRYNMIPNPLWKRIVMSDHLYSAFTDLEKAYKAGLVGAPAANAPVAITDEQIEIIAMKNSFAKTMTTTVWDESAKEFLPHEWTVHELDKVAFARAVIAASMGEDRK